MVARFILFVFLFAFVFAFVAKWLYIPIKRLLGLEKKVYKDTFIDVGYQNNVCKKFETHNFKDKRLYTKCTRCGKSVKDVKQEEDKEKIALGEV